MERNSSSEDGGAETPGPQDPLGREAEAGKGPGSLDGARGESAAVPENLMAHLDEVRLLLRHPPLGLITDIDGTLAAIAPSPGLAKVTQALRQALGTLAQRMAVAVVTGRDVASARSLIALNSVTYVGNHGVEWWQRGNSSVIPEARTFVQQVQRLATAVNERLISQAGVLMENKGFSLAMHYRQAPDPYATRELILDLLARTPEAQGLAVQEGKMVVEVGASVQVDKGGALRRLVEEGGLESVLVLGDDRTDIDSFRMLGRLRLAGGLGGLAVAVLGASTPAELLAAADYALASPEAVEIFLLWLVEETGRA